jgi:mannosyl-3-phosphoglycerate synthase
MRHYFLSHSAFVVSHKSESVETLLGVLWYLPINSPIIVVTNCPEDIKAEIAHAIAERLPQHDKIYLVHQKDEMIAHLFKQRGVEYILGPDGRVVNGKGEGMYIGALFAQLLGYPRWLLFYDADNFVPSALLEYTLAMARLFTTAPSVEAKEIETLMVNAQADAAEASILSDLHNIRICWSSKPDFKSGKLTEKLLGRCTRIVSPLFNGIVEDWLGEYGHYIVSSNAGEQGMTMQTAQMLRFSSGFSVETLQMLDFLFLAGHRKDRVGSALLQQYQSKSPHFHEKKEDEHIKKMIADSLGSFLHFESFLPYRVKEEIQRVCEEMQLELTLPIVYPALQELRIVPDTLFTAQYTPSYLVANQGVGIQFEAETEPMTVLSGVTVMRGPEDGGEMIPKGVSCG